MNILIVDDDSTSRIVLSATLKKLGHQVTVAANGAEAWTVFENGNVPLLISDMVMPDVDGLELCRRIRAANRPKYTYIIMLTSVGGRVVIWWACGQERMISSTNHSMRINWPHAWSLPSAFLICSPR